MKSQPIYALAFIVVLGLLSTDSLTRGKIYGSTIVGEVTSIYDGDSFRVNIEGWPPIIGERIPIRVNGVDAPEIRGKSLGDGLVLNGLARRYGGGKKSSWCSL